MNPMGGRTWKYWPAAGPVFLLGGIGEPRNVANLQRGVQSLKRAGAPEVFHSIISPSAF